MNIIHAYAARSPAPNGIYYWGRPITMALVGPPIVGLVDSEMYYDVFGALQAPIDGFMENLK